MEALLPDGSYVQIHEGGGSSHVGVLAIQRVRLIFAKSALETYIKSGGTWQTTRNGAQNAIRNVIAPLTGKSYKRSMNGKREALADCEALLGAVNESAVIYEEETP